MTDGLKFCRDCRALHTPGYCPWPEIERALAEDKRAVRAIASFPLPGEGTSRDNYRRVLAWLYDGGRESVASLIIDLTMADMERERAERLAPQAPPDASVADAVSCEGSEAGRRVAGCGGREDGDG